MDAKPSAPAWRRRPADSTGRCNPLDWPAAGGVWRMKQRPRIYYPDSQKALIWKRWKQGATPHQIAGLFDRMHSSVRLILAETGGIRPAKRRRSNRALTLAEREEISRAVVAGDAARSTETV